MAITKERLEELINEGATIYTIDKTVNYPIPLFLDEHYVILAKEDGAEECLAYTHERVIEGKGELLINLYETQEQAEWHLKYHATRTEELNLPIWKEFITYNENIGVSFVGEDWVVYELSNDIDIYHKPRILLTADGEYFEEWQSTEENYEKACDLCLKLFKGKEE